MAGDKTLTPRAFGLLQWHARELEGLLDRMPWDNELRARCDEVQALLGVEIVSIEVPDEA